MQLTPRQTLMTMAHVLQQELFPRVEEELGPLNRHLELLSAVLAIVPLGSAQRSRTRLGRPAKDRLALGAAFLAKAILNLATTRDLIERLRAESGLRRLCDWEGAPRRFRMSPSSLARSPNSRPANCRNSYTRL